MLVMEDIVESGLTTSYLCNYLKKKGAASIRVCSLTSNPFHRMAHIKIDYLGLEVPDKFLIGYGLDYAEKYRYLPDLCILKDR